MTSLVYAESAFAGAWLTEPGRTKVIHNGYAWWFAEYTNSKGDTVDNPSFVKVEYKPYIEYGLSEDYSVGISPSFQDVAQEQVIGSSWGIDSNTALVSTDLFVKRYLFRAPETGFALSVIPQLELPGIYEEETSPFFGKKESFYSVYLSAGQNLYEDYNAYAYTNFEVGYRSRVSDSFSGDSGDSLKLNFDLSLPIRKNTTSNFGAYYTKTLSGYSSANSFLDRYGYDSLVLYNTYRYNFQGLELEVGYLAQPYARNSGVGHGLKFSIWHSF